MLGDRRAECYAIARSRDRDTNDFFLPLAAEQFEIRRGEAGLGTVCAESRTVQAGRG